MTQRLPRWHIKLIGYNQYYAELEGERSETISASHCKACAFVSMILKYGGDVNLRGLSQYGLCYQMLKMTVLANRTGEKSDE